MDIEDLIKELEEADFGSKDLDLKVAKVNNPNLTDLPDYLAIWPSAYTTSVDAALSLVPGGWHWGVASIDENDIFSGGFQAYVTPSMTHFEGYQRGEAKTAPLAICIAALKARKEEE